MAKDNFAGLPIHRFDGELIHCGKQRLIPDWNPYDGIWECPSCGEDVSDEIGGSPSSVTFDHTNQNPNF